jgi:ribokinase
MSRVYVFGSINMDVVAFAPRQPKVGETLMGTELRLLPGGKGANQAVAAKRGGADTALVGRLGDDPFAVELRAFLEGEAVDLGLTATLSETSSGTAIITVADSDNSIIVIAGANAQLDVDAVDDVSFEAGDVAVAQFETPQETTRAAFAKARAAGARTILNPAPAAELIDGLHELCDFIVLNESELAHLVGGDIDAEAITVALAMRYGEKLKSRSDQTIVVTLGAAGVVVGSEHLAGRPVKAVDTTGAGDCFVGNLAARLAAGETVLDAAAAANRAASLCVQTVGAAVSMPTREQTDRIRV